MTSGLLHSFRTKRPAASERALRMAAAGYLERLLGRSAWRLRSSRVTHDPAQHGDELEAQSSHLGHDYDAPDERPFMRPINGIDARWRRTGRVSGSPALGSHLTRSRQVMRIAQRFATPEPDRIASDLIAVKGLPLPIAPSSRARIGPTLAVGGDQSVELHKWQKGGPSWRMRGDARFGRLRAVRGYASGEPRSSRWSERIVDQPASQSHPAQAASQESPVSTRTGGRPPASSLLRHLQSELEPAARMTEAGDSSGQVGQERMERAPTHGTGGLPGSRGIGLSRYDRGRLQRIEAGASDISSDVASTSSSDVLVLTGEIVLDGRRLGQISASHQARLLSNAPSGTRAPNLRAAPLPIGAALPLP